MRTVDVDGVATTYHDLGHGPTVLLLHGSGPGVSAGANWRGVLPDLARQHRVVAPDLLGFGDTRAPTGHTFNLTSWMAHLTSFCAALGLQQVSVIGNSFGGALALRLALGPEPIVDRLVLMGSVGVQFPLTPGLNQVWGFRPSPAAMRELLNLFSHDRTRITDELAEVRLTAATRPGVQQAYASMFPAPRQAAVDTLAVDERSITNIRVPTLILHGRDDQVIPLATSLRLHQLIAPSQLHVFGQCGHWVQIEQRKRFLALVHDFLHEPHPATERAATGGTR